MTPEELKELEELRAANWLEETQQERLIELGMKDYYERRENGYDDI